MVVEVVTATCLSRYRCGIPGGVKASFQPSGTVPFANAVTLSFCPGFHSFLTAEQALLPGFLPGFFSFFPGLVHFERAAVLRAAVLPKRPVTGHFAVDLSETENVCRKE